MSATDSDDAASDKPKRRNWIWIVLAVLVVIALVSFLVRSRQPAAPEPAAETARVMELNPIEVTKLEPQLLEQTIKVTGTLAPERRADLSPQVSGKLQTVSVRPGDSVKSGQVLAQIDVRDLQLALNQQISNTDAIKAQLTLARTQLETTRTLVERGLAPKTNLDSAESNVDALAAQVAALDSQVATAKSSLGNASIIAPFDGIIASRSAEPGQSVAAGNPILTIVDLSTMEVQTTTPLSSSALITEGQRATLSVEGIRDKTFEAEVDRISPVAIENTRSIPVFLTLENPDGIFRGGMFTTGFVVVDEVKDAIAVPSFAIREDKEGPFVLKIDGGKLVRAGVERGAQWSTGNLVQITSGLTAGDTVVTGRLPELEPDMNVAITGN
jgi:membrane fusion protein (multidrug efflux system)